MAGAPASKPARLVAPSEDLVVLGPPARFVSRGGEKLDAALTGFGIDVASARVLDVGASTGGFTDCCLQRGAASVVALDVGHGQLHPRLRADPRVTVVERTNVRHVGITGEDPLLGERFTTIVADVSFISLATIAPAIVARLSQPGATLVLLVKPQFEVGRKEVSAGRGVVRDPALWRAALDQVVSAYRKAGAAMMGVMASPLAGADGNVEFLLHAAVPPAPGELDCVAFTAAVDVAVAAPVRQRADRGGEGAPK